MHFVQMLPAILSKEQLVLIERIIETYVESPEDDTRNDDDEK